MKLSFLGTVTKHDNQIKSNQIKSNKEKYFSDEEAINLMVSLSSPDANSEKKWRGFYNSLSKTELEAEWDEYWKD